MSIKVMQPGLRTAARPQKLGDFFRQAKLKGRPGLPILSVTMDRGVVRRDGLDRKVESELSPEDHLLVQPGDLAYNMMRMWQGAMGVAGETGLVSPAYVVCSPQFGADSRFFCYLLKSPRMLKRLHDYSCGLTGDRLRLYFRDFASVPAEAPCVETQKRIAWIMSTWDSADRCLSSLIEAKRDLYKGLSKKLLAGIIRLSESRKSVHRSGLGRDWTEHHLGELFEERREINRGNLPLLSITAARGVIPQDEINDKDTSSSDKSNYKRIAPGDIGYNTMRMWQGVSALSVMEGIVSPAYTICIPKPKIDSRFSKHLFKFPPMVRTFWRYSQGLVDDTLSLKFHNFAQIKVKLPPIEEQRHIADVLDTINLEINLLVRQAEALTRQKKGLLQKLLTSRTRVKARKS